MKHQNQNLQYIDLTPEPRRDNAPLIMRGFIFILSLIGFGIDLLGLALGIISPLFGIMCLCFFILAAFVSAKDI